MKVQTQAILKEIQIADEPISVDEEQTIAIEFSAIDTGGGFKDPMIDFSIAQSGLSKSSHQESKVQFVLSNPNDRDQNIRITYHGAVTIGEEEINGRVTEEALSEEAIRFVFKLLR